MTQPFARTPTWFASIVIASLISNAVLSGARTLISYRALQLGGDAVAVGVITAAFALVPLLAALRIGRAVDRGRGVAALRLGMWLTFISVVVAATSTHLVVLGIASAFLGLAQMLHNVACQSMIALWSPADRIDHRFGNFTLAVSAGQLVGFPIVGLVASLTSKPDSVTTGPALLVMAAIALAAVPMAYTFDPGAGAQLSRDAAASAQQSTLRILGTPGMKPAMYSSLTVLTALDLLTAYLPVLGEQLGLSVATVTTLLTARAVASVFSRAALPLLLRKVPRRALLVSATLASGLPMALVPLTESERVLLSAMLIMGFFWGIGQPLTMSWVATGADPRNRAAALSVRLAGNRLGQVTVPLAAGSLAGLVGVSAIFYGSGLLLVSSGLSTLYATRPGIGGDERE